METSFDSFKLLPEIIDAIKKKGYEKPTPIQEQSIPLLLEGHDLLGIAQTGTGKTAAFTLPIITRLKLNKVKTKPARMRCLILTPTRELASQIDENLKIYAKGLGLKSFVIFGGVSSKPQIEALVKGMDIIVATPGRLLDLMGEGHVLFDQLEYFVLDEADRMLDMGFINDVKKIIKMLPVKRQTILFSATMPQDIIELSSTLLSEPQKIEVTPESTTVEKIDQKLLMVHKENKPKLLKSILRDRKIKSVLVFVRTKHTANRLATHLEKEGIPVAAIHGDKSQNAREMALGGFKKGKIRVLIATDIAARGIDISHISHVINYNLPDDPKSYVHRIGRTARAGREGVSISFCDESELPILESIEKTIRFKIPVDKTHPYHGVGPEQTRTKQLSKHEEINREKQKLAHKTQKKEGAPRQFNKDFKKKPKNQ